MMAPRIKLVHYTYTSATNNTAPSKDAASHQCSADSNMTDVAETVKQDINIVGSIAAKPRFKRLSNGYDVGAGDNRIKAKEHSQKRIAPKPQFSHTIKSLIGPLENQHKQLSMIKICQKENKQFFKINVKNEIFSLVKT